MTVRSLPHPHPRLSCVVVLCVVVLCALATVLPPQNASADENDPSDHATCHFGFNDEVEYCGWIDTCTHDSVPLSTPVVMPEVRPNDSIESAFTIIATAACASAGVTVDQVVEPYAMVGPYLENASQSVNRFQRWWNRAVEEAEKLQAADAVVASEPIDYESLGPSVLVSDDQWHVSAKFVGGAPMIATMEQAYMPYDIATADLRLWSVFPLNTQPFCIRSRHESTTDRWNEYKDSIQQDFDHIVGGRFENVYGSADCILGEWIWKFERWTAEDSPLWPTIQPRNIGKQLATVASRQAGLARDAARFLAERWPSDVLILPPSRAGAALLARANATEAATPKQALQIAKEAPRSSRR